MYVVVRVLWSKMGNSHFVCLMVDTWARILTFMVFVTKYLIKTLHKTFYIVVKILPKYFQKHLVVEIFQSRMIIDRDHLTQCS